jgi:hypothetical protein
MTAPAATRALLRLSLVCLTAAAFVAVVALLAGELDDPEDQILAACAAIALYNATASAGVALLARPDLNGLGAATIGTSAFALLFALLMIADDFDGELAEPWGIATAAALALTQAAVMLGRARETDPPAVRAATLATVGSGVLLAGLVITAILAEDPDDEGWRVLSVVAVVNVLGMLLAPILRRLSAPQAPAPEPGRVAAEAVVLAAGRLDAELALVRANGAELLLAPVDLAGGGRLAAVRTAREIQVLIERGP